MSQLGSHQVSSLVQKPAAGLGFNTLKSLTEPEPKPAPEQQPLSVEAVVNLYNSPDNMMSSKPEPMKTQADKQAIIQKTIELAKEQEEK